MPTRVLEQLRDEIDAEIKTQRKRDIWNLIAWGVTFIAIYLALVAFLESVRREEEA